MGETPDWVHPSTPPGDEGAPDSSRPAMPPPPQWPSSAPPPPQWAAPPAWGAPTGPGWGFRADYKPGIVPLRPLSVGDILDGGFATVRRHPRLVFGVALVLAALTQLVSLGLGFASRNVGGVVTSPNSGLIITTGGVGAAVITTVIGAVFTVILTGVVSSVVGKAVLGQPVDGRETIRAATRRWLPLFAVGILAGGLPLLPFVFVVIGPLGFIPAIALGIYLWGQLALALPAFVLERLGPIQAIKRSWNLVRGAFWRVWGLRALVFVIVGIAASVLSIGFRLPAISALSDHRLPSTTALVLSAIGNGVVWAVTQPILAAALTLLYVDRRIRAEGFDIQLTRAAQASASVRVAGRL